MRLKGGQKRGFKRVGHKGVFVCMTCVSRAAAV